MTEIRTGIGCGAAEHIICDMEGLKEHTGLTESDVNIKLFLPVDILPICCGN